MTKDVIHRIVSEALTISLERRSIEIEEQLIQIISHELTPRGIAEAVWEQYKEEMVAEAVKIAAEQILPF